MIHGVARLGRRRVRPLVMGVAMVVAMTAGAAMIAGKGTASETAVADAAAPGSPEAIASRLSAMLQSARAVISKHQAEINDPAIGDKNLGADVVIAEATENYKAKTGEDPASYPPDSRQGRLIRAQIDAIRDVMDKAQDEINKEGVAFKGFIPATFARLVNESFAERVKGDAHIKVTAPPELVRNRKARPDDWEKQVIAGKFRDPSWSRGAPFAEVVAADGGGTAFRMAVPEYYAASCLSCHGSPKGSIDITGYPREGAAEGDLSSVISITLAQP
ncbi:DUF3365 domain-containing protein [Kaistia geumhonensis]|nr:DUF3365 domain-containing protein [Kaistia geumhonensis]MCX5479888.1 DUF3365 domain-containing protein [Kaistia geumhonensis]